MRDRTRISFALLTLCAALGWWGVLYPQLTMTPDTYRIVSEDGEVLEKSQEGWDFDGNIYTTILNTDSSHIRFRSGLLKYISKYLDCLKKE